MAIIVAGCGHAGVAEDTGRQGMAGPKKSVVLPELRTHLLEERSCAMEGFCYDPGPQFFIFTHFSPFQIT